MAMVLSTDLFNDNPWWKSKNLIDKDREIKGWESSVIKWDPRIRHRFLYNKDLIYSLRGPRQVGKTTLVKLQIRDFLKKGISPWNIMYYAFDVDNTPRDLMDVISSYLDNTNRHPRNAVTSKLAETGIEVPT